MFTGTFGPYMIGSLIAALGQPFLMNIPSKIASTWFGDKERAIATAVGGVSVPIGTVISFLLPQAVISDSDEQDHDQGKQHFALYIMIQTMIVTIICIPALSFMREQPLTPPSVVANETNNHMSFFYGLKELISNKNYMIFFFLYLLIQGIVASSGAIYANLAANFEYSLISISISSLLFLLGGIINSFILGSILDKYQNYKRLVQVICILSLLTCGIHIATLPLKNAYLEAFA